MKSNSIIPSSASNNVNNANQRKSIADHDYTDMDAEKRLPFRSIPTQMNGMARANKRKTFKDIDLTKSTKYNPNNVDAQYAIREKPIAKILLRFISNDLYKTASIVAIILALFLYDASRTMPSSGADNVVECTLIIIFMFFLIDLVFQSIVYQSYIGSFFFWLDLIGTVTLLADLSFVYTMFGSSQGTDMAVAKGGRAGRAARTANTLRMSRMLMWVRITRLVRVARMLRQVRLGIQSKFKESDQSSTDGSIEMADHGNQESVSLWNGDGLNTPSVSVQKDLEESTGSVTSSDSKFAKKHSGKIGMRVADSITRNVVFGILLTVALVPIFIATQEESYSSLYLALDLLNDPSIFSEDIVESVLTMQSFGADIYYLESDGVVYRDNARSGLRNTECFTFDEDLTTIKLDISKSVRDTHGWSIGLTLLVVLLFGGLAFKITRQISKLVVRPIERMTHIVQEFTKNICLLGGDLDNQHRIVTELLETEVIEAAITTLSSIFSSLLNNNSNPNRKESLCSTSMIPIQEDANYTGNESKDVVAPLPSLKSQMGTTLLRARDSMLEIQIKQSTRVQIEDREIFERIREFTNCDKVESFCVSKETISNLPELASLTAVMSHPIASEYFRVYCTSHLLGESYFFVKAVTGYHEAVKTAFKKVYDEHVSVKAAMPHNFVKKDREKLKKQFEDENFGIRVFDGWRRDTMSSLTTDAFKSFERSAFALAYIKSRERDQERFAHIFKK